MEKVQEERIKILKKTTKWNVSVYTEIQFTLDQCEPAVIKQLKSILSTHTPARPQSMMSNTQQNNDPPEDDEIQKINSVSNHP